MTKPCAGATSRRRCSAAPRASIRGPTRAYDLPNDDSRRVVSGIGASNRSADLGRVEFPAAGAGRRGPQQWWRRTSVQSTRSDTSRRRPGDARGQRDGRRSSRWGPTPGSATSSGSWPGRGPAWTALRGEGSGPGAERLPIPSRRRFRRRWRCPLQPARVRGVVDAVAHHGNLQPAGLEFGHLLVLVRREHFGEDDVQVFGHCLGHLVCVSGDHGHLDSPGSAGPRTACRDSHRTPSSRLTAPSTLPPSITCRTAAPRSIHARWDGQVPRFVQTQLAQQRRSAHVDSTAVHRRAHSASGRERKPVRRRKLQSPFPGGRDDRAGHGMFAVSLHSGRECQHRSAPYSAQRAGRLLWRCLCRRPRRQRPP